MYVCIIYNTKLHVCMSVCVYDFKYCYYTVGIRRNVSVTTQGDPPGCPFILAYTVLKC